MAKAPCYHPNCDQWAEYALSWRIRGPLTEGGPRDRIMPGFTDTVVRACGVHVDELQSVLAAIFRAAPHLPSPR